MLLNFNQSKFVHSFKSCKSRDLHSCKSRDLPDTHKMADELIQPASDRERDATFKFIDEIQSCPDLWEISSSGYKDAANKQKKMEDVALKSMILCMILPKPYCFSIAFCCFFDEKHKIKASLKQQLSVCAIAPWTPCLRLGVCCDLTCV